MRKCLWDFAEELIEEELTERLHKNKDQIKDWKS